MSILDDEENYFAGTSGSGAFLGSDEDVSISPLFAGLDLNALGIDPNLFAEGLDLSALLPDIIGDADVMNALKAQDPDAYAALLSAGELSGFAPVGSDNVTGQERVGPPASQLLTADGKLTSTGTSALTGEGIIADEAADVISEELGGDTNKITKLTQDSNDVATAGVTTDKTGTKSLIDTAKDAIKDITGLDAGDAAKYAAMLAIAKLAYDDAQRAREEARGWSAPGGYSKRAVRSPGGGVSFKKAASGGVMSLDRGGTVGYTPEGNVDPYASFRRSGGISYKEPSGVNTSFAPFIFGSSDPISQTGRFDEKADFREPSGKSLIQARYNDEYAPEGIIANEVMQRAIEDYPFQFNPNIIPLGKDDALISGAIDRSNMLEEAKNNILNQVVSIDQITGDIDPVQTIRNVLELEPKIANALPEIQNLQTNVSNLQSNPYDSYYLRTGIKSPYLDEGLSPSDLDAIRYSGKNVQNTTEAIGSLLNERFIDPGLYKVSYPFIIDKNGVPLRDSFGNFITSESNSEKGGGEGSPRIGPGGGGAAGGIASLQPKRKLPPRYLDGHSDGMADKVPANIDGKRPAALSDGEFVIPADVVSHLGNGNSNAGAKRLYKMMDDIRAARTGNPKQGKQINPDKFMPR